MKKRGKAVITRVAQAEILVKTESGRSIALIDMRKSEKKTIRTDVTRFDRSNPDIVYLAKAGRKPHANALWYYKDGPHIFYIGDGMRLVHLEEAYAPYFWRKLGDELKRRGLI